MLSLKMPTGDLESVGVEVHVQPESTAVREQLEHVGPEHRFAAGQHHMLQAGRLHQSENLIKGGLITLGVP